MSHGATLACHCGIPHARHGLGLRGLVYALIFGSIGLPMVLGIITMSFVRSGIDERPSLRFAAVRREVGRAVDTDRSGRLVARPGYRPPEWLIIIIADKNENIVYTNVAGLEAGQPVRDAGSLFSKGRYSPPSSLSDGNGNPTCVYVETVEKGRSVLGTYYALVWPIDASILKAREGVVYAPLFALLMSVILIVAAAVVSTFLVRDVMMLDRAAARIASGDLETEVRGGGLREIATLAASMDSMRRSLLEERDRRNRFLASISHDLRTPLTSIGGYLEAVEDGLADDPEVLKRYVKIMEDKTKLLESRVQGLLDYVKMETDEWNVRFEPVDLYSFLRTLSDECAEEAALGGRRFERELGALKGISVEGDPALLTRVFENLFSNALRYTPPSGLLRLSAVCAPGAPNGERARAEKAAKSGSGALSSISISIDDSGPGIAPAERGLVFEPFYRAPGRGEGHGLGLYIVRSILRGHGWSIEVGDSPLGGARFTVIIPRNGG